MPLSTRKTALAAAAAFGILALAACGGGGGGGGTPQTSRVTLPEGHSVEGGSFTVAAGKSVERGGVRFSCAAGGAACAVVVDTESGQARVTGGRLTAARVPAAAPQPASVTLPQGHSVAAGSFSVAAGQSVERGGVRFSCAAGGAACAVVVDTESGQARVTGGRLTVARVQAAAPQPGDGGQDDGQNGGMEEADWSFPDWPVADLTSGGGTLAWTPSEIYSRIRAIEDHRGVGLTTGNYATYNIGTLGGVWCTGAYSDEAYCNVEYSSVKTHLHGGIPIVQARALNSVDSGVDGRPGEEIGVGGILRYGYFMVARQRGYIGRDYEDEDIEAIYRDTWSHNQPLELVTTGRWRGALVGTGRNATSPLYRQFIIGNVDVTVRPRSGSNAHSVDVAFSNIRNHSTGDRNVTLSHMQWNGLRMRYHSLRISSNMTPGFIGMEFLGPNDEEVLGVFHTEEAVGGFGARKQ